MRGPTLPYAPTKTYGPTSVDLKEKQRKEKKTFLSLFTLSSLPRQFDFSMFFFRFYLFLFYFIIIILLFEYMAHIASFGSVYILKQFISFKFTLF